MNLGHKQKGIIELGKKKGFITSNEARKFWFRKDEMLEKMNTLVILGYFEKEKDDGLKMIWEYKNGKKINK